MDSQVDMVRCRTCCSRKTGVMFIHITEQAHICCALPGIVEVDGMIRSEQKGNLH